MSERGSFRGGGHGGRGPRGGGGGDRRGGGSSRGGARHQGGDRDQQEKPKKENILDLTKYMDKEVIVKFNGGREGLFSFLSSMGCVANDRIVSGILKGYDQLMNLVLDDVKEKMRGMFYTPLFLRLKY